MKCDIPQEILDKATQCGRGFACLDEHGRPRCNVEYVVNEKIMFVRCLDLTFCNYQIPFGDGKICSCPVRIALWRDRQV
jgi:hypothetical protein